jgi:ribosomal protein L28
MSDVNVLAGRQVMTGKAVSHSHLRSTTATTEVLHSVGHAKALTKNH